MWAWIAPRVSLLTPNKRWTIATLVSARAGDAAGKTQEPKPKQQSAQVSCDRSWQGQLGNITSV